jgi:hypothetical protein
VVAWTRQPATGQGGATTATPHELGETKQQNSGEGAARGEEGKGGVHRGRSGNNSTLVLVALVLGTILYLTILLPLAPSLLVLPVLAGSLVA